MKDTWSNLVTLEQHLDFSEALVVQSLLAAYGIPTVLPDDHFLRVHWTRLFAIGGARIQIPRSAIEEARDLLQSFRQKTKDPRPTAGRDSKWGRVLLLLVLAA